MTCSGVLFALGVLCYFCRMYEGKDRIWWPYLPGLPPRHPPGQDRGAASKEEALFQQFMRHEVTPPPLSPPKAFTALNPIPRCP